MAWGDGGRGVVAGDRDQYLNLLLEDLWRRVRDHSLSEGERAGLRRAVERGWPSVEQDLAAAERGLGAMARLLSPSGGDDRADAPIRCAGWTPDHEVPVEVLLGRVTRALHGVSQILQGNAEDGRTGETPEEQSDVWPTAIEGAFDEVERHLEAATMSVSLVLGDPPRPGVVAGAEVEELPHGAGTGSTRGRVLERTL